MRIPMALILGVILIPACREKNLLGISDVESKSRFFSPANTAGLQNDTSRGFSGTFWLLCGKSSSGGKKERPKQ